ncbi:MAG: NAD(P)-dependent oxidoreductase [Cyclobacteriaceae bacterium]|nr:NAD(P)-dependent oxidoreductase [Cyclobacteriaceae bacterium]
MKVLITGANGLLGQKLVELMIKDSSLEVIATARGANRLPINDGYTFISLDITSKSQVLSVVEKVKPEVVVNTAAMTNVDQCELEKEAGWHANVDSVAYLVEACEQNNCFLLHLSTDFIFDGTKGPLTEEEEPNPVNYYGEGKLAAEKLVKQSGLKWAIARTVLVYGVVSDMSRSNIILWVKNSLEQGKSIKVVDDQWRTPTLAEDLATGCYLIAKRKAEGIFNISGKDMLTPYDMAIKVKNYFNLDGSLISRADSSTFSQPAKRPPKTGFVIDKARKELGYNPHSFDEGIEIVSNQVAALQNQ